MVSPPVVDAAALTGSTAPPARYWAWLAAMGLSLLGTQVLAFGMTWAAASLSGALAGLVLTTIVLPRVLLLLVGGAVADRAGPFRVLLLVGGAVADRAGPFRVLLLGDGVMVAVTLGLAVALGFLGLSPPLLLAAALAIGVVDAFYLPASGTMPRRLAPGPPLARAMAARQLTGQVAAFAGAPLGGLLVALAGLAAAALFDAATFAVMFLALVLIRPRDAPDGAQDPGPSLWRRSLDGLRLVATDRALRPAMVLVCAAGGLLLPVSSLLVPLLGRERGWSAGTAGLVVGAVALGTASVALTVLARSTFSRPELAGPAGLLLAAGAVASLAMPVPAPAAVVLGLIVGLGTGTFVAHVGPLVLGRTPASHMSRVQAVLVLAQSLPLLATNPALGATADLVGPPIVLAGCGALLAVAAGTALASRVLAPTG